MPMMKMSRDFLLRGTTIPSIRFFADVECFVAPIAVKLALHYGAVFVDDKEKTNHDKKQESNLAKAPKQAPIAHELGEALYKAFEELVVGNIREDFTASGTPRSDKVKGLLGYDVTRTAIDEWWQKFTNERAGNSVADSGDEPS